jgi:hypothetical protein
MIQIRLWKVNLWSKNKEIGTYKNHSHFSFLSHLSFNIKLIPESDQKPEMEWIYENFSSLLELQTHSQQHRQKEIVNKYGNSYN